MIPPLPPEQRLRDNVDTLTPANEEQGQSQGCAGEGGWPGEDPEARKGSEAGRGHPAVHPGVGTLRTPESAFLSLRNASPSGHTSDKGFL